MGFLAPLFFAALAAVAIPVFVHLIQRERKDIIEFPSLMFLQRIPYESVERRRIHNWWLLALRTAAMALVVAAFARPFFAEDPIRAAGITSGAREIVVLLDRSASMGYGDRWARAQAAARAAVADVGGGDRATLVLFDHGPEEVVRGASSRGEIETAIDRAAVSSGSTRYAPALRLGQSLLGRSTLPRQELVIISDFQRTGWQRQEQVSLPEGTTITPVTVADPETAGVSVLSVAMQRAVFSGQERVTLTAGLINRGAAPVTGLPVQLEIDGRAIETRETDIAPGASASVTFSPMTVAEAHVQGAVRAGTDALPRDNDFYFVLSPGRPVSVLVIQRDEADSPYLPTALALGRDPSFEAEVTAASRVAGGQLSGRAVVILDGTTPLSTATADLLTRFVEQGGGLLIVLGDRNPAGAAWPLFPGTPGGEIERPARLPGTLGFLDYSHPIFDEFKDPRHGSFAGIRFLRYRALTPGPNDRVLARFDDGSAAMVERRVGSGRVIAFTSTLDGSWNDVPKHGMFLPFVHEAVAYLAQYEEPAPWHTVGRMLDISGAVGSLVRSGGAGTTAAGLGGASGVIVSPSGAQTVMGAGGVPSIELSEQGFYSVRLSGTGSRRPYAVAVNLDPEESDLTAMPPEEFVASATGQAATAAGGAPLDPPELTPIDLEKRQSIWWYLLVAGLLALLGEAVVSNRLASRAAARG